MSPPLCFALLTRVPLVVKVGESICSSVSFTIKSFVDEYTTEEVEVTAEEGETILSVAQENGASINCIISYVSFPLAFCGGNCHCGGCHIKLSQSITDMLPLPSEAEKKTLKKCVDVDER